MVHWSDSLKEAHGVFPPGGDGVVAGGDVCVFGVLAEGEAAAGAAGEAPAGAPAEGEPAPCSGRAVSGVVIGLAGTGAFRDKSASVSFIASSIGIRTTPFDLSTQP